MPRKKEKKILGQTNVNETYALSVVIIKIPIITIMRTLKIKNHSQGSFCMLRMTACNGNVQFYRILGMEKIRNHDFLKIKPMPI